MAGLISLLTMAVSPASLVFEIWRDSLSQPFRNPIGLILFLTPSLALVIVALLLFSGLNLYKEWKKASLDVGEGLQAQRKHVGKAVVAVFVLGALLLVTILHRLYWLTVWDNTYDPFGYLWLALPLLTTVFSTILLSMILPHRTKLPGFFFLFISTSMFVVSASAQRIDFRQLTDERAKRVSQAIESYYDREGQYPQDLQQLGFWYIFSLPEPVIIYGQNWCYDGGDDYYRLGYVYREHWSDPRLSGRVFSMNGETPVLHRMCDEEITALQIRHPDYPYTYWASDE
jgi:hypothetical protein